MDPLCTQQQTHEELNKKSKYQYLILNSTKMQPSLKCFEVSLFFKTNSMEQSLRWTRNYPRLQNPILHYHVHNSLTHNPRAFFLAKHTRMEICTFSSVNQKVWFDKHQKELERLICINSKQSSVLIMSLPNLTQCVGESLQTLE
jgi:hypothetical protein